MSILLRPYWSQDLLIAIIGSATGSIIVLWAGLRISHMQEKEKRLQQHLSNIKEEVLRAWLAKVEYDINSNYYPGHNLKSINVLRNFEAIGKTLFADTLRHFPKISQLNDEIINEECSLNDKIDKIVNSFKQKHVLIDVYEGTGIKYFILNTNLSLTFPSYQHESVIGPEEYIIMCSNIIVAKGTREAVTALKDELTDLSTKKSGEDFKKSVQRLKLARKKLIEELK